MASSNDTFRVLDNADPSRRMPAEWEPHLACLVLYPHNPYVFRSNCQPARIQVKQMAKAIAQDGKEDVLIFCKSNQEAESLAKELEASDVGEMIHALVCPSDDTWARDTGPTFCIESNKLIGFDWEFNAYGGPKDGCYWPCDLDRAVAEKMCRTVTAKYSSPINHIKVPLVLEGGSIHVDGEGTLLTTSECLLHENRNPSKTKEEIENILLKSLGCTKAIWLPYGLAADQDTNGHVDNIACFVRPRHVLLSWCDDKEGDVENYNRCRQALKVLEKEVDAKGRSLTVHKLHLPPPMYYTNEEVNTLAVDDGGTAKRQVGERLAASYVNFYIANHAVICPQFGVEESDGRAVETLRGLFPERKIVPIASREILLGGGNIHCFTQQVPATKAESDT